jgi:hypothetical protein
MNASSAEEARVRRAFALGDVDGRGLAVKDIDEALLSAGTSAPQVERCDEAAGTCCTSR